MFYLPFQAELLTEQMAQFVSCTPWMRQEIFDEAAQVSAGSLLQDGSDVATACVLLR
jgi:hypothetical protein